jgi:hypothetical protein
LANSSRKAPNNALSENFIRRHNSLKRVISFGQSPKDVHRAAEQQSYEIVREHAGIGEVSALFFMVFVSLSLS